MVLYTGAPSSFAWVLPIAEKGEGVPMAVATAPGGGAVPILAHEVVGPYRLPSPPKPMAADSGTGKSEEAKRADDLTTLFGGGSKTPPTLRVTRMRADLSRAALAKDRVVRASTEQAVLSDVVSVTREKTPPNCPVYDPSCSIVGNAPRAEAEDKNKALSNAQYGGGGIGARAKRMGSCRVGPSDMSLPRVIGAAALAAITLARRRR